MPRNVKQCGAFVIRYVETTLREIVIAAENADEAAERCNTYWHQTTCPIVVEGGIIKGSMLTRPASAEEAKDAIFVHGPNPHEH